MAENITGMDSCICGGRRQSRRPFSSRRMVSGFSPRNTRVSIGSRRGSTGGFVTCEALMSSLSQYTGKRFGLPMEDSRTPPLAACL